jgi:hypothetical protein
MAIRGRCGRPDGQQLSRSRSRNLGDLLHATPLGGHHERRSPVRASQHASEAAAVNLDGLQYLTAFADAHATLVGNVAVPHSVVGGWRCLERRTRCAKRLWLSVASR